MGKFRAKQASLDKVHRGVDEEGASEPYACFDSYDDTRTRSMKLSMIYHKKALAAYGKSRDCRRNGDTKGRYYFLLSAQVYECVAWEFSRDSSEKSSILNSCLEIQKETREVWGFLR